MAESRATSEGLEPAATAWHAERREVARVMRRIYRRRLTNTSGGNVSCRASDGCIVITPASVDKGRVRARSIAVLDPDGRNLTPDLHASSESPMHIRIYQAHPEVGAVVHAHPVTASAFTCGQTQIDLGLLCETYALLDPPVLVPYMLSGTAVLADSVAEHAGRSSTLLIQNHAVITTGANLAQAFSRLEVLEEAARVTLLARHLEGVRHLTDQEQLDLDQLMGR